MDSALAYLNPDDNQANAEKQRLAQLAGFAATLTQKRKQAVDARKASGIEAIWLEDEAYYNGVDELNKSGDGWIKGTSPDSTPTARGAATSGVRSTVFVNITQPYVDLVSAREGDMLFPVDDKPFGIEPTPIPDIENAKGSPELMPDGQMTQGDAAKQFLDEAKKKAEGAEEQIWDWIAESNWHTEGRKVVAQKNMLGTGVLKGPYPTNRKQRRMGRDPVTGAITIVVKEEIKPASKWIDIWDLYPDPACGEDIHAGSFIFEKEIVTGKQLRELKGSGYLNGEIDAVLKEGPGNKYKEDGKRSGALAYLEDADRYEIWYYHGIAKKDDLIAANCPCEGDMNVMVVMVNDHIIKATQSLFDSGEFPYDVFVYQPRMSYWAGIGVARQVRTAQRMVNAASRNLMDNAGVAAGPQIVLRKGVVRPVNNEYELTPLKLWLVDEDADVRDVQSAFTSIVIPTLQQELEAIIRLALEFAERATSMPLILQGQQGAATDTVGGMQLLQSNSNTVLRRSAKLFDDVIERHISRYYEWLMLHGDKEDIKGDYSIIAKGSSALYERDAQNQVILNLLQFSANPAFGLNPERLMVEVLKSNKISPDRVMLSEEEKQQLAQQQQPSDPALEVAKIRGQSAMQVEQLKQQSDMAEIQAKAHAAQSDMALKLQMAQQDRDHEMRLKELDYRMKMMELSQSSKQSLDSIKAALASDSMKLSVQKELSYAAQDHAANQSERDKSHEMAKIAMAPPTEPVGKAKPGHAYEQ